MAANTSREVAGLTTRWGQFVENLIDRGVDRYAYQRGLWVIKQTGDTVTLANDLSFQPRSW